MARRSGTMERVLYKHGLLWWMFIGWWWRPIAYMCAYSFGDKANFRQIKTTVVDKPLFTWHVVNHKHGKIWWIFVGWWWCFYKYAFLWLVKLFIHCKIVILKEE